MAIGCGQPLTMAPWFALACVRPGLRHRRAAPAGAGRYDRGMKLYTRRGDGGCTELFGGARVDKADLRIETYGTVDELNCALGLAAAVCSDRELSGLLASLQAMLFDLGADLASPRRVAEAPADADAPVETDIAADAPGSTGASPAEAGGAVPALSEGTSAIPRPGRSQVEALERAIDDLCDRLPPLRTFILPGGDECAARLHLARAVCRRAERLAVRLSGREQGCGDAVVFLNRLSDLLFAMARRANQVAGVEDVPWTGPSRRGQ